MLRQAVAFIDEQFVRIGKNIFVADNLAQLTNQLIIFMELLRTSGHWNCFLTGDGMIHHADARMEVSVREQNPSPAGRGHGEGSRRSRE